MQKLSGKYRPLYYGLLGGLTGAVAGGSVENAMRGTKSLGACVGAGAGVVAGNLVSALHNYYDAKQTTAHSRITPGLYCVSRPVYAGKDRLNDIPFLGAGARHSLVAGIFDKAPKGIETVPLPNGQHVTTLTGAVNTRGKQPYHNLYALLNGKAGTPDADSAMGTISGDFIVTKMDETRQNGKVVSWNVELKPTFTGTALTFSLRP